MSLKPSKTIDLQVYEAQLKIAELKEQYETQLYFETMPKVDPLYKYCYQTSNFAIQSEHQSVDAWLRAVIKHMGLRMPGHGGQKTNALVVTMFKDLKQTSEDMWIDYITRKLRKLATGRAKKEVNG